MVQHTVIQKELGVTIKSMKGFRNSLVHRYGRINDEIAFTILHEHFQDFYTFSDQINTFIKKNEG